MTETPQQAAARLTASLGKLAKAYEYSAEGEPVFWNLRIVKADGSKTFRMMTVDAGGYQLKRPEELRPEAGWPLYGLHSLATPGRVWIVEGEKDADSLHALGLPAVTSGSTSTCGNADWTPLRGRDVVLWPDNDEAGLRYMTEVVEALQPLGCDIERITPETLNLPPKADASDWLALHPGAGADDVLALLPKVSTTAELLDECRKWVHRYCIVNRMQGIVLAAWVLHTWAIDSADFTPSAGGVCTPVRGWRPCALRLAKLSPCNRLFPCLHSPLA